VDGLGRLYLVWGSVVGAFLVNGALAVVQVTAAADGIVGVLQPGRGPVWAPSLDDLLETPTTVALRPLGDRTKPTSALPEKIALLPERPFLFGTMMGGPGAFLALGALALPLGLALLLHLICPRGSRESLSYRLKHAGQGSLVVLLVILMISSVFLVGFMAGPWFCLPFALALAVAGLPTAGAPRSRFPAIGMTALLFGSLGLGAALSAIWPVFLGGQPPVAAVSWDAHKLLWTESLPILKEFPLIGTGFGSFGAIYPYFKAHDASSTTAMSSLLRYGIESGAAGIGLAGLAAFWCLRRLSFCLKRVSPADRALAYGLIGAALGFSLWSVVHWTIELPAVAISASALGGTWNRWLAGGTDLFVERGT
jgi:hypothetical protein